MTTEAILINAENAVAGTPPVSCGPHCQPCRRVDLQLLVVTPSVVPKEHEMALKAAGYNWAPSFDAEFGSMKREATTPVARLARAGYFMVYYPHRQRWDVWQIAPNGLTRKVLHQVNAAQYGKMVSAFNNAAEPKTCSRQAANLPASLINIEGGLGFTEVWLAYTPRLWAPEVLQRFADNPVVDVPGADGKPAGKKKLRELLGRTLNPKGILEGSVFPSGCLPLNAAALQHNVADFVRDATLAYRKAFDLSLRQLDEARFGKAEELDQAVRSIEKASSPPDNPALYVGKSLIVMLPDAVGVAEQHNTIRLTTLSARQGWMAGGPDFQGRNKDPNRPWERQSLLHAGYIRDWVRNTEYEKQKRMLDNGAYNTTQIISGHEYRRIREQEKATGKPTHPAGTQYERLQGGIERYRVIWPEKAMQQGLKDVATADTQGKIERYNKHIDWGRVEAANKKWLEQEKGWQALLLAQDTDYVGWLKSPVLAATLRYTHIHNGALRKAQLKREEIETHMHDAAFLLEDTARCHAGGPCSDASLKHWIALFEKDPKDKTHWIAEALIGQYDFWSLIGGEDADYGLRADLYTGALGVHTAYHTAAQGMQLLRQGMAQHASLLAQSAHQTLAKMQELALDAGKAGAFGLKSSLDQLRRKQVIWVKASALHEFLETGAKQFYANVVWEANAFVNAASDAVRTGPAFEVKFNQHSERRKQNRRSAAASARAELRRALADAENPKHLTVPLLMDEAAIEAVAKRGHKVGPGMLQVVGGNLLSLPQMPLALPESFARDLFREQAKGRAETFRQWTDTGIQNARGALPGTIGNGFIFFLQWHAFTFALDEFNKKGGWAQVDAAASALSAAVGMVGAGLEVGAMLLAPTSITRAGTPAAGVLVSQLPKAYLRLGLGAGWMGGTGALLDLVVAWAKARGRWERGDSNAYATYFTSAVLHLGGSVALFSGAWMSYRSARLTQAGVQGAVRILSVRFASSFAAAGIGMSASGIGMFLWVAGVGFSVVAAMLEDDENEIFLERSYFGYGRNTQLGKFSNLEDEMQALATLARGFRAELEWEDNWTEPDVISVRLQTIEWDRKQRGMSFVLDGFDEINGKPVARLAEGELDNPMEKNGMFEATSRISLTQAGVKAVKLTFTLWDTRFRLPDVPLVIKPGVFKLSCATKIAEDFIWMKD